MYSAMHKYHLLTQSRFHSPYFPSISLALAALYIFFSISARCHQHGGLYRSGAHPFPNQLLFPSFNRPRIVLFQSVKEAKWKTKMEAEVWSVLDYIS